MMEVDVYNGEMFERREFGAGWIIVLRYDTKGRASRV
jgi:hypothetical protein